MYDYDRERLRCIAGRALISTQNQDGGIPAVRPGDPSGSWTTASTLESILVTGLVQDVGVASVKAMANYLVDSQIKTPGIGDTGSWPLISGGQPSTMSTANASLALHKVITLLDDAGPTQLAMRSASEAGVTWLCQTQSSEGGWAPEPSNSIKISENRTIATVYALYALSGIGLRYSDSPVVRRACDWLWRLQNERTWPESERGQPDPGSTARALRALLLCDFPLLVRSMEMEIVQKLTVFRTDGGKWPISVESMIQANAPGAIIFNQNTNVDAILAMSICSPSVENLHVVKQTLQWLESTVDSRTGMWRLQSPTRVDSQVVTWSTAEWLSGVYIGRNYLAEAACGLPNELPRGRWRPDALHVLLAILLISAGAIAFDGIELITTYWRSLSTGSQSAILALGGAIGLGLLAEFLLEPLRPVARRIYRRLVSRDKC